MRRLFLILTGIALIILGVLSLPLSIAMPFIGLDLWRWGPWRLWPLVVIIGGLFFVLPPLLAGRRRGLGGLFIPGVPILTTGAILLLASLFNVWSIWEWLWPLEVLALALGFTFAAISMRVIWLIIPAAIIGMNGLALQFCALTGLWEAWTVLWIIEPLSLGLALLLIGAKRRSGGLFLAGLLLCGLAGMGLVGMTAIFSGWWWLGSLMGPAILILLGFMLLIWGVVRRSPVPRPATK